MKKYLIFSIRLLIGILFIISGISKIIDLNSFQKTLKVIYIPEFFVSYISFLLPIFEIFLGIFLSIGILTRFISIVMFLLVVIFTIMISIQMIIGNSVEYYYSAPQFLDR